jgi:hypothetical protein
MARAAKRTTAFERVCRDLGVPAGRLARELRDNGILPRDADLDALDARTLAAVRAAARTQRLKTRTSQNWVAGYPELVAQWHPTRNVDLFPDEVSFSSHRRIWWKCDRGPDHEWQARPNARTAGRGCPFCAGQRASITNCIATLRPDLAALWHPTRNGERSARDVTAQSHRVFYWQCTTNARHTWRSAPSATTGCPLCAGKKISPERSLAKRAPDVAREWHPTRNDTDPAAVFAGSKVIAWWRCRRGHEWRAAIKNRALRGQRCPVCVRTGLS